MFGGTGAFNFGATTTTAPASATPSTGFTFGATQPQANTAGFNFGAPGATTTPAQPTSMTGGTTGFAFGGTAAKTTPAAPGGFTFGGTGTNAQATTTNASAGLTFGGAANTQAAPATGTAGFPFGAATAANTQQPSSTFSFGGTGMATAGQQKSVGFALGTPAAATMANSGFKLGTAAASTGVRPTTTPTVTPTGSFTFGAPGAAAQRPSLAVPGTTATPTAPTGFTLGTPQAATTTSTATKHTLAGTPAQSSFGSIKLGTTTTAATPATNTATTGFTLGGGATTTTPSTGLTLGSTATSTAAPTAGFGFGATTSTVAATAPTKTTLSLPQMNYQQLEEAINKWTVELEEQEKIFLQQATQVNAWDRLLIENGEKITTLNSDVERVKLDQQRLDNELDFIRAQQRELEELLSPLEDAVQQLPSISYQQHADLEREHTYQLSENIDAQLKRMVQDLKEIIDHVNSTNTGQDNNDPIHQITKILNAHMDSLQWIDHNSGQLNRRVEEISRQMDSQRKEQERNFRLAYD